MSSIRRLLISGLLLIALVVQPLPFQPPKDSGPPAGTRDDAGTSWTASFASSLRVWMDKAQKLVSAPFSIEHTRAEVAPQPSAEDIELTELRTENSKVFEKPGGRRYARVYPGPVHYKDAPGDPYKDIDNRFVLQQGRWRNKANRFQVSLGTDPTDPQFVKVTEGSASVSFGLPGVPDKVDIQDEKATLYRVAPGVDLELQMTNSALKETIILHEPRTELNFPMSVTGVSATVTPNGSVELTDPDGKLRLKIPKGLMEEAPRVGGHDVAISEGVVLRTHSDRWHRIGTACDVRPDMAE
ncbi:MAG: hypothetical protein ABIS18_09665 [Actinomycetota bacterium]